MAEVAVRVDSLAKRYGTVLAVRDVSLRIPVGTVYCLVGPNGAGKTTTVRVLATLVRPDSGTAQVMGFDVVGEADQVRRRISLTGQYAALDADLTGVENLCLLARLLGHRRGAARRRADELVDAFRLGEVAGRLVRTCSGGERRRLDVAAGLLSRPDVMFLDEPTTGLDPRSRQDVWQLVRQVVSSGTTVVLTTQYLDEADQLAARIAVLDAGRVVAEGTSAELKSSVGAGVLTLQLAGGSGTTEAIGALARVLPAEAESATDPRLIRCRLPVDVGTEGAAALATEAVRALAATGIELAGFSLAGPTLDEVFLAFTDPARTTVSEVTR